MKTNIQGEDDLTLLIKSMSSTEKRYFRIFSQNEVYENKAYMLLFDILNSAPTNVNNTILKQKLSENGFKINIVKTKQYLFNHIIKSLILFNIDKDNEIAIKMKILEAKILLKKNMLQASIHKLKLLEKICITQNRTFALAEIYGLPKTNYANTTNKVVSSEDIENFILKDKENSMRLITEINLKSLLLELNHLNYKEFTLSENDFESKCKELYNDIRLQIDVKKQSYAGQMYYFLITGYLNLKLKNFKDAVKYFSKYIKLLDENKYILKQNQFNYISGLGNLIAAYGRLQQYNKIENVLVKLKNMKFEEESLAVMQMKSYYLHICQLYTETRSFSQLSGLYASYHLWVSKNKEKVEKQILLKIEYCFALAFLVIKKYGRSLMIINGILSEPKIKNFVKIAVSAKIIAAICHFEKGDYDVMQSVFRSLSRQLLTDNLGQTKEYVFSKNFYKEIISVNNNYNTLSKKYDALKCNAVAFDFKTLSYL